MRKLLLGLLTIVILAVMVFSGCTEETTPTPAPTYEPVPTTTTEPEVEPIVLKLANAEPPPSVLNENHKFWIAQVEALTNGKVKIEPYWAGALGGNNEIADNVEAGIADVGFTSSGFTPGRFPINDLMYQLNFKIRNGWHLKLASDMMIEAGLFDQDFTTVKLMYMAPMQSHSLYLNQPATTMEDLSGLRIRTQGTNKALSMMGMDPLAIPYGETEMSLERGILDGVLTSDGPMFLFNFGKHAQYCIDEPFSCAGLSWMIMNLDTWNSLPPDVQEAIQTANYAASFNAIDLMGKANANFRSALKGMGVTYHKLEPEELARWKAEVGDVAEEFAADLEAKGVSGAKAIYEQIIEFAEKTDF